MSTILKLLSQHLKNRKQHITRRITVDVVVHDPTYGDRTGSEEIEVVDFDALCDAIDQLGEMIRTNSISR